MSKIITEDGFVADTWAGTVVADLSTYSGGPAVALSPADDPAALIPHLATLRLVTVAFGSSADGRGFSQAAQLRALGYQGHIRASGHILVDQFRAARRSGIDDIEISDAQAARNPALQWQSVPMDSGYKPRIFAA